MTDLLERLRRGEPCREFGHVCGIMNAASGCDCAEAAAEIERLRALPTYERGVEDAAKECDGWAAAAQNVGSHREQIIAYKNAAAAIRALRPPAAPPKLEACPICGGDCASANPPMAYCPMRDDPPLSASAPAGAQPSEEDIALAMETAALSDEQ